MDSKADPITMEVVRNALSSIADEMALVIMRTAYSSIVRDSMDYSTGVCDRNGRMVAHGLTMALHLGSFPDAMHELTSQYAGRIYPGDIFVFNDPYVAGGMHLPDVYIIKPVFHDDVLEGYVATLAHQIDVGGIAPGSTAVYATEIYQEGLRIPIVKLYERGEPNETFFKIMALNTRMPDKLAGDMRAQVAACRTAENGVRDLIVRHGPEGYRRILADLHDYAERVMRSEIDQLPDGTWSFTDYIDGFGETPEPIALKVSVTIAGDQMTVDWTGSSPEVPAAINCPPAFVKSAVHLIVKCLSDTDIPNFEGFLRPLEIILPEAAIVNPSGTAACAARAIVGWRAIDVLLGVFSQIVPNRVPAAGEGGVSFPAFSGTHDGKRFVCSETWAGSWGAMCDRDGEFGVPNSGGNITNQSIEMIEAQYPIEVQKYGMVENSGGPGKFRGAPAYIRQYRMLGEDTVVVMRSDRRNFLPYGLDGGSPGTPSWNLINPGANQRILPVMPMEAVRFARDDIFCHIGAGGGGHGDPLERDPHLVREDVREERITQAYAETVYGVVFITGTLDVDDGATIGKRSELRKRGSISRPVYLEIFHHSLGIERFELVGERYLKL